MENEIMNNEMNVEDVNLEEDVIVVCEDPDNSDENPVGAVIALAAAAVVGITALILKRKGKFDEWRIKRLEKKGYVVLRPDQVNNDDAECCEEIVAEEIDD
jgi:hypothetical protein